MLNPRLRIHIEVWTLPSFAFRGEEEINILYKRHLFMQHILLHFFSSYKFYKLNLCLLNTLRARKTYFIFLRFFVFLIANLSVLKAQIAIETLSIIDVRNAPQVNYIIKF